MVEFSWFLKIGKVAGFQNDMFWAADLFLQGISVLRGVTWSYFPEMMNTGVCMACRSFVKSASRTIAQLATYTSRGVWAKSLRIFCTLSGWFSLNPAVNHRSAVAGSMEDRPFSSTVSIRLFQPSRVPILAAVLAKTMRFARPLLFSASQAFLSKLIFQSGNMQSIAHQIDVLFAIDAVEVDLLSHSLKVQILNFNSLFRSV